MKISNKLKILKNNFIKQLSFLKSFFFFLYFIIKNYNKFNNFNQNNNKNEFVILIHPWDLNTTPWYSITLGIILSQKNNKVEFLIDDLPWNSVFNFNYHLIEIILFSISKHYKYNKISTYNNSNIKCNLSDKTIESFAFANSVHYYKGEVNTPEFHALKLNFFNYIKYNQNYILESICLNKQKTFIIPGGIYQNTIIYNELLRIHNVNYYTFDSGFSIILFAKNGIAAQMRDIHYSFNLLKNSKSEELNFIKDNAYIEFNLREKGNNLLNSQYVSYEKTEKIENIGFLIPLNSPWDAAALNINTFFNSYNEWLISTIRLIIENSNDNITIRQHPDERHWWGKTNTNFKELIYNEFGENKRIIFISCYDKINTYYLLDKCKAVICYSSTIGIESIIKGKPTAVCSNVYYARLNFVYNPLNINSLISFIRNPNATLINSIKENALVIYYLGQKCNWLKTRFTPMSSDFSKWVCEDIIDLCKDESITLLISAIEKGLPLSYLVHKNIYNEN